MQATIGDILERPASYAGQIVNIDGMLLVTAFDRAARQFEQVWLVSAMSPARRGIQAHPIKSDSTLWHGLSRLSVRHLPGFQSYRIHDAIRACVKVVQGSDEDDAPRLEILTAAIYREDYTLFVGENGVRLDQALPDNATIDLVSEIQLAKGRFFNRVCQVYGTLTIRTAPAAQFLSPGKIPYRSGRAHTAVSRLRPHQLDREWLDDIAYPQSNSRPEAEDALQHALRIDGKFPIGRRLSEFPGINQIVVKPAIIVGSLVDSGDDAYFASITDLHSVYVQNIRHSGSHKSFESVIKLKKFAEVEQ